MLSVYGDADGKVKVSELPKPSTVTLLISNM